MSLNISRGLSHLYGQSPGSASLTPPSPQTHLHVNTIRCISQHGLHSIFVTLEAIITSDIPCTCNGASAVVYLQKITCGGNNCRVMSYELLLESLCNLVKTISKSGENWLRYQRIRSKIFSRLKLLLQAIASNSNVQSQVNYLQRLCKALRR